MATNSLHFFQHRLRGDLVAVQGGKWGKIGAGPPKYHLPTGGPNITKTEDILAIRMPYHFDDAPEAPEWAQKCVKTLSSSKSDVEARRAASAELQEKLMEPLQSRLMLLLVDALYDEDLEVRLTIARTFQNLCSLDRWPMDEWIARVARKLEPDSEVDLMTRILSMRALGWIGPWAAHYSGALRPYFDHEEEFVRLSAIEAVRGFSTMSAAEGPSGEVGRHKKSLVRLMREDPSMEVRKMAEQVLDMKDWKVPHWMEVQKPAWRERVKRAIANRGKGTRKGKNSEGTLHKRYWEKLPR
ncbi:hypothetical protein AK812_SmicGene1359 [Symbiodinium microadriaticum]|uniref:HEAT repeat domain-containing protein n=2 Tax=Symbiodinium TaxID=2949 RepID=A0A1Q9F4H8_SYMMI|nr:hypothetical protein AK812_SmicGene1359 [Symbiodinium microadriaticum]